MLYPTDRCEVTPAGHLIFDGVDLVRMAQEYPTPFFLLSETILRANYQKLVAAFADSPGFKAYYSVKTNYESGIMQTLRDLGAGAEVSGALDLEAARRAGFRPPDVVFDGPGKTEEELRKAIDLGLHLFNVESESELAVIDRLARDRGRVVKVGVRIDPIIKNPFYSPLVSAYKQKFGFPADNCDGVFELARRSRHVEVVALHAHVGSQIRSPELYVTNLEVLVGLAAKLIGAGFRIQEINMGGGFPAQSVRHLRVSRRVRFAWLLERLGKLELPTPDIAEFGRVITQGYRRACAKHGISPTLTAEPGRSLVSNAGIIVGRVHVVKGRWVFSDISINDVPENLFFSEFRTFYPNRFNEPRTQRMNLSGPTLATNDVVLFDKDAPVLAPGDLVALFDTGAYSISRSNQFTRPRNAAHFVRRDGRLTTIRRRELVADVMRMQVWEQPEPSPEPQESAAVAAPLGA
jgi:diaminopimelate decarboxylase